jgi:hypothetical protein
VIYAVLAVGCLWWMVSWQGWQATRILRRFLVMRARLHGLARSRFSQAGELADSVHNDLGRFFAQFTSPSQEPGDQLLAEVRGGRLTTPGLPCPVTGVDSPIHTAALALHDPSGGPYHQN